MANSTEGKHLIVEYSNCNKSIIDNLELVDKFLKPHIQNFNLNILSTTSHKFQPTGFTLLYLLSESHLSMHTWPLDGYVSFDLYSCGLSDTKPFLEILKNFLQAEKYSYTFISRGIKNLDSYVQSIEHFI
jgi:S-adenosylmethionine decarboxylase